MPIISFRTNNASHAQNAQPCNHNWCRLPIRVLCILILWQSSLTFASQDNDSGSSKKPTKPPTMPKTKVEPPDIPQFDPSTLESVSPPLEAITLVPGWNFVSIPEQPDDPSAASVLAPIEGKYFKVWAVDNCDTEDPWKLYQPSDLASSDLETIDPTKGMWIKSLEVVDLPSTGTMAQKTSIHLCPGWNLIGFPLPQIRTLPEAMRPFEGKYRRVMTYDATATRSQWDVYSTDVPEWGNDLWEMKPGRAYWVLATEEVTAEFINEGPPPEVEMFTPDDLTVVTEPIEVLGAVRSIFLDHWTLRHRPVGETEWTDWATGDRTTELYNLAYFDPTLLLNGLYEIQLTAVDWAGQTAESEIRIVSVEGNMKIGNFTLSFVDLAVPVSGLDLEIIRTYDSRDKLKRDFGVGWSLDIRQGSYRNNRAPGDGWQLAEGFLPCDSAIESKAHVTTVRLSDREIYRFALRLVDGLSSTGGGCYAHAEFEYVDGPIPGATLEILGNIRVFQETRSSDRVLDLDTLQTFEPQNVRLTTRDKRVFDLDLDIGVTRVEDPNGNQIDITEEGIFHSVGKAIEFERDDAGRIVKIIDPMEYEYLYAYDDAGDLITTTDPHRSATKFVYDDDHRIVEIVDPRGVKAVRSEYDADGRLVKVTDARGMSIELKHELDKNREVIVNRLGNARIFEYDRRGNVVAETDELGFVTKRTYDGKDRLLTETDPLEHTTTNVYTASGDLKSITDPMGHVTSFEYNVLGAPIKITDPHGNPTILKYDSRGNLQSYTDPIGSVTLFAYSLQGNITSSTDALKNTTYFQYNAAGNLSKITNALGHKSTFSYNRNGQLINHQSTRTLHDDSTENLTINFTLDALGRIISTIGPDGAKTSTSYDQLGSIISTTDPLGQTTYYSYNPFGNVAQIVYPNNTSKRQAHDAEGRLISKTDRVGNKTTYSYTATGRLHSTTFPDGSFTISRYDGAGQLVEMTNPRGHATIYTYDAAGRQTQTVDAIGNETRYTYDGLGNQTSYTDPSGNTTYFSYDKNSRLTEVQLPNHDVITTAYNKTGQRTTETDQHGFQTSFTHDALGRLTQVTDAHNNSTYYRYDEQGNRILQIDASRKSTSFQFDSNGRITKRTLPEGSTKYFTYDLAGNNTQHIAFDGTVTSYAYSNNLLTRRNTAQSPELEFTYTANGKMDSMSDSLGVTKYLYDTRDQLIEIQNFDGSKLIFKRDNNGNITEKRTIADNHEMITTYIYDAADRLKIRSYTYTATGYFREYISTIQDGRTRNSTTRTGQAASEPLPTRQATRRHAVALQHSE